jgi:hypothetical protein
MQCRYKLEDNKRRSGTNLKGTARDLLLDTTSALPEETEEILSQNIR